MMDKDSVTWDRPTTNGIDALGHPVTVSASGFPRTVLGNWQETNRGGKQSESGQSIKCDAWLFSESYHDGLVGDAITRNGRTYRVVVATPRFKLFSSAVEFMKYGAVLEQTGAQQIGGA